MFAEGHHTQSFCQELSSGSFKLGVSLAASTSEAPSVSCWYVASSYTDATHSSRHCSKRFHSSADSCHTSIGFHLSACGCSCRQNHLWRHLFDCIGGRFGICCKVICPSYYRNSSSLDDLGIYLRRKHPYHFFNQPYYRYLDTILSLEAPYSLAKHNSAHRDSTLIALS